MYHAFEIILKYYRKSVMVVLKQRFDLGTFPSGVLRYIIYHTTRFSKNYCWTKELRGRMAESGFHQSTAYLK